MLFALMLTTGLVEMTGVASVVPLLTVVANPEVITTNAYLSFVYNYFNFQSQNSFLIFLGCSVFTIVVTGLGLNALTHYFTIRYTFMRGYTLSARLMKAYLAQPYSWFLNRHSGDLGKNILSEVGQVVSGVFIPLTQLLARLMLVLCIGILLLLINPVITISVVISIAILYSGIYYRFRQYLTRIGQKRIKTNQQRFQAAQEAFGGIKEIKAGGLEKAYYNSFAKPAKLFARYQVDNQIIGTMPRYIIEVISFGGILLILLALLISRQGNLTQVLPTMGVFAFAAQRLLPAMQAIYHSATTIKNSIPALDALHQELTEIPDTPIFSARPLPTPQSLSPMGLRHALELRKINYGYPNAQDLAIKGISMHINAKTTVGFVGSTGAGKTTLVDIILGLLQPSSGKLSVDGRTIAPDNILCWQRTLGYVPQQIFLADDTVAANIAFGIPLEQIDEDALLRAARIAEVHEFINGLQEGYGTLVGERGVRLSGGQRQRIGIARALYHDPDILIMDEATSALDNLTEKAIMTAVKNLGKKKTIIIVAHRLSTVKNCDTIYLLKQGELKAQGSYKELLSSSEDFAKIASAA